MKLSDCMFIILSIAALNSHAQSFSCSPEHVTLAGNNRSSVNVEKTKVNWERIEYHVIGDRAIAMTYKNASDASARINPLQRDELVVLENSPARLALLGASKTEVTLDVIFPQDGNGHSFYVSDYPKSLMPGGELVNLSKLYLLKCKDISRARP